MLFLIFNLFSTTEMFDRRQVKMEEKPYSLIYNELFAEEKEEDMKNSKRAHRILAWLLTMTLIFTMSFSSIAYAAETDSTGETEGNTTEATTENTSEEAKADPATEVQKETELEETQTPEALGEGETGTTPSEEAVAKIGTDEYATLEEAVAAVEKNETIVILNDIDITDIGVVNINDCTIDLGGHTISANNFTAIFQGKNLVLKNGKFDSKGGAYALFIGDEGETENVIIEDCTLEGGINIYNAKNIILRNVTATGTSYYSVWIDEGAQASIESGCYKSNGAAVLGIASGDVGSSLNVIGGNYTYEAGKFLYDNGTNSAKPVITGGVFSTDPTAYVPTEGYVVTEQSDGTWNVTETHKEASIGSKRYETLDSAISEAGAGDTVKLLDNVDYSTAKCFDIDKKITIDLNGKEITAVSNGSCSDGGATHFIRVKNGGDLTITDSSEEKDGCITATYGAYSQLLAVEVMSGGKFAFNGGKIQNAASTNYGSATVYIRAGGTFILDGGTVAAVKASASKRSYAVWNVGTMKMISGLITSNDSSTAAVTQNAAKPESEDEITMEITGGVIDSASKEFLSISQNNALPVISGGQFSGALNVTWIADGAYGINGDTGSTIVAVAPEDYQACINQKLFYTGANGADDAVKAFANGDTLTLKKTPGEEVKTTKEFSSGKFTVVVENDATFDTAAIRVKAGYTVEAATINENTTEYNVVVDKEKAQVRIGDTYYTTLANANANAKNGDTITVIKDVTGIPSTIYVSKELTIDLNGHLVQGEKVANKSYPNGPIIKAYKDETKLTIIDSSEEKRGKIENTAASGSAVFADKGSVVINGGAFIGQDAAVVTSDKNKLTVSGGYYLDRSAEDYLADGKTLVESDKAEYTYMVADKKAAEAGDVEIKSAVGDVVVDNEAPNVVREAIAGTTVSEKALDAAVKREINKEVAVSEAEVEKAKNELGAGVGKVTVFAQAYLNIKINDENEFTGGENAKCVLDITPMYQIVATTANSADDIEVGTNAVVIGEAQPLEIKTTVEVTIPLPDDFATKDDATVTIKHTKRDSNNNPIVYYYNAVVKTGPDGKKFATFTNPNGFSTFEALKYSDNTTLDKIDLQYGEGESLVTDIKKGQLEYDIKFDAEKNAKELAVKVAPTANDSNAKIKVLLGGIESKEKNVDLGLGTTTFNVLVLAEDDTAVLYTFNVTRCELVDNAALSKTEFTYNGRVQTPAVTVKTAAGTTLKNGDDYTVSYKGNRLSVGTHTVNVYCKGSYEGEISKTYTINPAKPGIKKIKSSKRKMTVYMTSKPGSKGAKAYRIYYKQKGTSTWKSTTTTSSYKTIKGLKKGKRYYVKVYAYTGSYKSAYSSTKLSKKIR